MVMMSSGLSLDGFYVENELFYLTTVNHFNNVLQWFNQSDKQ